MKGYKINQTLDNKPNLNLDEAEYYVHITEIIF